MKNFSQAYAEHVKQPVTTLAVCWRVVRRDGVMVLGTTHDRDITVTETNIGVDTGSPAFDITGVYRAGSGIVSSAVKGASDMSVDNMEVAGALRDPDLYLDIAVSDIRAGLYDGAQITTFRVNWQDPSDFQEILRHGVFGQVDWDSDGSYRTEVRGLAQVLQQTIGRIAGETCDVEELGDVRCKLPLDTRIATGVVTAVTSSRRFNVTLTPGADAPTEYDGYYVSGKLTWTTGDNVRYTGQVKSDAEDDTLGHLLMWDSFPEAVRVGDQFLLTPGCDRRYLTCRDVHNNLLNFRGPGIFCPGPSDLVSAP